MRVLVTGCDGQVGTEVAALSDRTFDVRPFARRDLDITSAGAIEHGLEEAMPDVVVNCAAYTAVDRAEDESEMAYQVNAEAVELLGHACARRGIAIIHLSTDYVFDGHKDTPYTEDDPTNPLGVYGASKLAGEVRLREATNRHVILRVSWVFGRLGRGFPDTILRLGATRDELTVVDDQIGTPSPAALIASAIRRIAEKALADDELWGTYHFATQPAVSWCAFARRIVTAGVESGVLRATPTVRPISTADWPAQAARPLNSRLNARKASQAFGLKPMPWTPHLVRYVQSLEPQRT